jgi:predicted nucleic acid-binding protein
MAQGPGLCESGARDPEVTEAIVVDSSVFVAHFWMHDLHHSRAQPYLTGLENGDFVFHIPTPAVVEMCAVLKKRVSTGVALAARRRLQERAEKGLVMFHALDNQRATESADAALNYGLDGADAVFVGLAEELGISVITFDIKSLARRYPRAVIPA